MKPRETMRRRSIALLFVVLCATASAALGQEPSLVYGRLTSADGGDPISGALVRLIDDRSRRTVTLRSDEKGRFTCVAVRPGRYRATIERDGFAAVDVTGIDVRSADRVRLYVEMTPFDDAPFQRQTIRYARPMVNVDNATLTTRVL